MKEPKRSLNRSEKKTEKESRRRRDVERRAAELIWYRCQTHCAAAKVVDFSKRYRIDFNAYEETGDDYKRVWPTDIK